MEFCIRFVFIVLLSFTSAAVPIYARKDPNAYWGEMVKEQDMPEAIKDFMNHRSFEKLEHEKAIKDFIKDFEPIPNISIYHDDANPKQVMKSSDTDCNNNLHHDDKLAPKKLSVADVFEPIPNISIYNN